MPEGDTVHQIVAALRPYLLHKMLLEAAVGREPEGRMAGAQVDDLFAHGKHLFLVLSRGVVVRVHLGLHGTWHSYRPGEAWRLPAQQASLVLATERNVLVCFQAQEVELMRREGLRFNDVRRGLGPDLAGEEEVDLDAVLARARELLEPETPIVDALLDQRVASGIGNVTKSELLFHAGVHPRKRVGEVSDEVLRLLFATARKLLRSSLAGPRRTRPGDTPLWVYDRAQKPCLRCGTTLEYAKLGRDQRGTTWCPRCQGESADEDAGPGD